MISKPIERERAIALRREGMSLRDIVKIVPVAKSTLSLWLKQVSLSRPQKQRLTQKRLEAALRGAERRKSDRIALTQKIFEDAAKDVVSISKRELWLMGVMLYWAEGAKEKESLISARVQFSNSDPFMIILFTRWLNEVCGIMREKVIIDLYIHEDSKNSLEIVKKYWLNHLKSPIDKIYFKKNKNKTNRKNTGVTYFGLIRITVRSSSCLNRKIEGWIKGINQFYCGIV